MALQLSLFENENIDISEIGSSFGWDFIPSRDLKPAHYKYECGLWDVGLGDEFAHVIAIWIPGSDGIEIGGYQFGAENLAMVDETRRGNGHSLTLYANLLIGIRDWMQHQTIVHTDVIKFIEFNLSNAGQFPELLRSFGLSVIIESETSPDDRSEARSKREDKVLRYKIFINEAINSAERFLEMHE